MGFDYEYLTKDEMAGRRGLFRIDHEDYHAGPGVSSSQLKALLKSPAHSQVEIEQTPAMEFGTAFHTAILEPELFADTYVVVPKFDRRTKQGKADYAEWMDENEGKSFVTQDDMDRLLLMQANVAQSKYWDRVKSYDREVSVLTTHKETGLFLKCRPDMLGDMIIDFKTTQDASPEKFFWCMYGKPFLYAVSAAYYQDIVADVTGRRLPFVFCAVEKTPPYGVAWYEMKPAGYEQAARMYQWALRRWHECSEENKWPGYPDEIVELEPPASFFKELT